MPREKERIPVSLEVVLESSSGKREVRISDLSMSGCYIDSIATVREGETVFFSLKQPTGDWARLSGEVVYILQGFGFGIRFVNLSEVEQKLLEQFILAQGGQP